MFKILFEAVRSYLFLNLHKSIYPIIYPKQYFNLLELQKFKTGVQIKLKQIEMPSLYDIVQKVIPFCDVHSHQKTLYYDVQQRQFLCEHCSQNKCKEKGTAQQAHDSTVGEQPKIFTLKQVIQNPTLLMLKQNSFLGKIRQDQYHFRQYLKILTEMDNFTKNKKSSHQVLKQLLTLLKQQIVKKIQAIIQKSQHNCRLAKELQTETGQLKKISREYSNQFIQTLQTTFVDGTFQELKQILEKYSVQNENPFRKIDQKVLQVAQKVKEFTEFNWQNLKNLSSKLLDPFIWSKEHLFVSNLPQNIIERQQMRQILPESGPRLLNFKSGLQFDAEQQERQDFTGEQIYVKFCSSSIMLLKSNFERQFEPIHQFQALSGKSWDIMHELPRKMLMAIRYESIQFYSFQFNEIAFISELQSIKGCSEVLIFQNFCILLALGKLYRINYFELQHPSLLSISQGCQQQDTEAPTSIRYLFKNRQKLQNKFLVKMQNLQNQQSSQVIFKLF